MNSYNLLQCVQQPAEVFDTIVEQWTRLSRTKRSLMNNIILFHYYFRSQATDILFTISNHVIQDPVRTQRV
jgi:hypothetical protein